MKYSDFDDQFKSVFHEIKWNRIKTEDFSCKMKLKIFCEMKASDFMSSQN